MLLVNAVTLASFFLCDFAALYEVVEIYIELVGNAGS